MKVLAVAGARPNFMKIAPLMRAMHRHPHFEPVLIHTGQHYDAAMSEVFFDELRIAPPSANLGVGSGTRLEQIDRIKCQFNDVVLQHQPDAVMVVGDVNSTIACAEVSVAHSVPVIHVEAGLRSFDESMPEEINRIETDKISDYLFVTEASGMANLRNERISGKAFLVGNVMIDTLVDQLDACRRRAKYKEFGLVRGEYVVGTFHRPSNVDNLESLKRVVDIILRVSNHKHFVVPLHPRTRNALERFQLTNELTSSENVTIVEPLGYQEFISLVDSSYCVVTDSGGIQEETTYLAVPCITMRENTERPVTVVEGTNRLAGIDPESVYAHFRDILNRPLLAADYSPPELWEGKAANRIVDILAEELL